MPSRTVTALHRAERDDIGDLVTQRPVPGPTLDQVDPFLFLNHHGPQVYPPHNHGLPFGPHPHRGFETVTFILEGDLAHRDSGGHESVIQAGGVQWMTAGRGLVHEEVSSREFLRRGGPLEILQLWVNLPARLKFTAPRYVGLQRDAIPRVAVEGGEAAVVSGDVLGARGPFESLTGVQLATVHLRAGGRVTLPAPAARSVLLYVVRGGVQVGARRVPPLHLAELAADGDTVELSAEDDAVVLFGTAEPLREPVVSYGPFVMNTRQQIAEAIQDYQLGRFGPLDERA